MGCGVMKDLTIILGSVVVLQQPIAVQQLVGYVAAVVGIQVFNLVSRHPEEFETGGLVLGTWQVLSCWWSSEPMPSASAEDKCLRQELNVDKDKDEVASCPSSSTREGQSDMATSLEEGSSRRSRAESATAL